MDGSKRYRRELMSSCNKPPAELDDVKSRPVRGREWSVARKTETVSKVELSGLSYTVSLRTDAIFLSMTAGYCVPRARLVTGQVPLPLIDRA